MSTQHGPHPYDARAGALDTYGAAPAVAPKAKPPTESWWVTDSREEFMTQQRKAQLRMSCANTAHLKLPTRELDPV